MCGKLALTHEMTWRELVTLLDLGSARADHGHTTDETLLWARDTPPASPGKAVLTVVEGPRPRTQTWGLMSRRYRHPSGGPLFNVRAEWAARDYAALLARGRCVVVAERFWEWQRDARGRRKQRFAFSLPDGGCFAMAGLWERWQPPGANTIDSCTIITCAANAVVGRHHRRMPVILDWPAVTPWLAASQDAATLLAQLAPWPDERSAVHLET